MVILEQLEIEQYRGFFEKEVINFSVPDGTKNGSGLTILVGPNNTGKTTVIEALLLNQDKKFKESERHNDQPPVISIKTTQGKYIYTNISGGSQIQVTGQHNMQFEFIQSRRHWQSYSGNAWDTNTLANQSIATEVRNSQGLDTAAVLKTINKNSAQKEKLNCYIRKLMPHFSSWTIDTNDQGDYVKYGIAGREHQASFLGDGVISLFRICAHLVDESNYRTLIIDEPELSLHPSAQKALAMILSMSAKTKQIIVCTHSPYFTNWQDFSNGATFLRLNKIDDVKCEVYSLKTDKNYADFVKNNISEWQRPQALDVTAKEILFSERILFVEGQEDVGLIRKWLSENNIDQKFDIFGYGVGGYSNMKLFLEMASDLGLHKVAALYDDGPDSSQHYAEDKNKYAKYHFEKLTTSDIRDKYTKDTTGNDQLSKPGIFDSHGNIKNNYKDEFASVMQKIIAYFN